MNIVICEDIEKDANSLRLFIEKYFEEINCAVNISVYKNGDVFLEDFQKINDIKIAFLDIYMTGTNGIDTAKKIRETDKDMAIVFTTVSTSHALEGYSVDARQYLVKPIDYPEVKNVLDKCTEKFADSLRFIEVSSGRLTVRVYLKDIMYIECFDNNLCIHTVTETIETLFTLSELEKQLEGSTFLRTQRSYIVNMRFITNITANDFVLQNGTLIPIRRSDKLAIKQAYRDYLSALAWSL